MSEKPQLSNQAIQHLQELGIILKSIILRLEAQGYRFVSGRLIASAA